MGRTTVHLVDPGIDTGAILAQSVFEVTSEDSLATYPYLHLVADFPCSAPRWTRYWPVQL